MTEGSLRVREVKNVERHVGTLRPLPPFTSMGGCYADVYRPNVLRGWYQACRSGKDGKRAVRPLKPDAVDRAPVGSVSSGGSRAV